MGDIREYRKDIASETRFCWCCVPVCASVHTAKLICWWSINSNHSTHFSAFVTHSEPFWVSLPYLLLLFDHSRARAHQTLKFSHSIRAINTTHQLYYIEHSRFRFVLFLQPVTTKHFNQISRIFQFEYHRNSAFRVANGTRNISINANRNRDIMHEHRPPQIHRNRV